MCSLFVPRYVSLYFYSMIYDFLTPLNKENLLLGEELHPGQIGNYVFIFDGKEPEIGWYDIAIIGVPDDRGSIGNVGSASSPDKVRKEFYKLFLFSWSGIIIISMCLLM